MCPPGKFTIAIFEFPLKKKEIETARCQLMHLSACVMGTMMYYALALMDIPLRLIDLGIVIVGPRREPFLSHYLDALRLPSKIPTHRRGLWPTLTTMMMCLLLELM